MKAADKLRRKGYGVKALCRDHDRLMEACKSVLDLLSKTAVVTMEGIPFNHKLYIDELKAALEAAKGE